MALPSSLRDLFNRFSSSTSDDPSTSTSPETSKIATLPASPSRHPKKNTSAPSSSSSTSPSQSLSCTAADLFTHPLPAPNFSIPKLLPEGLTLLGAKDASMLTSLSVHLSASISTHQLALDTLTPTSSPILYFTLALRHSVTPNSGNIAAGLRLDGLPPSPVLDRAR